MRVSIIRKKDEYYSYTAPRWSYFCYTEYQSQHCTAPTGRLKYTTAVAGFLFSSLFNFITPSFTLKYYSTASSSSPACAGLVHDAHGQQFISPCLCLSLVCTAVPNKLRQIKNDEIANLFPTPPSHPQQRHACAE